ncbi:hypothetical protein NQ315_012453 [Exocentrus adspersus]|uniref:Putative nuclease HARBI1 n=1 Tax=Exocentrus adspersus TaxID=1586481 RepID=A0AAV8VMU7_9CUCU|nr:hypothetical protein NQ315_012453 [Exocentrus adspersus]
MGRATFNDLLSEISPAISQEFKGGERPVPADKKVLITLWWLGKGEVLLSVADKFNVTVSTVHKCVYLVLDELVRLRKKYIVWPDENERRDIVNNFAAKGFPGVVGAIDGCNIPFKAPADQHESYIDRKMQHSRKLQGVCIPNKIFTNVVVGWPGSVHDSRIGTYLVSKVFQNCEIFRNVDNGRRAKYFTNLEQHLVGDSAYPLLDWVLTPYR